MWILGLKGLNNNFEERGKPEYPEKNLSEQGREPTTNCTSLHYDYDENCLVSRFIDNVNIPRPISLTLFKLVKNSTPVEFAYVKHSGRIGIIALKFHKSRSHFVVS